MDIAQYYMDEPLKIQNYFFKSKKAMHMWYYENRGVYFSVCGGGGKNMAKQHVGGKNDWKGMKKGGEMHIFPQID